MTTALLQTTYFGPVQWYQKLKRYDHCVIEQYDSYQKQTYRNRCVIATANGLQALTVPVEVGGNVSVTITNGGAYTGMRYRVRIARVPSSSTMPMISVHFLSRSMNF